MVCVCERGSNGRMGTTTPQCKFKRAVERNTLRELWTKLKTSIRGSGGGSGGGGGNDNIIWNKYECVYSVIQLRLLDALHGMRVRMQCVCMAGISPMNLTWNNIFQCVLILYDVGNCKLENGDRCVWLCRIHSTEVVGRMPFMAQNPCPTIPHTHVPLWHRASV